MRVLVLLLLLPLQICLLLLLPFRCSHLPRRPTWVLQTRKQSGEGGRADPKWAGVGGVVTRL